jgi:hypothetical protein
MLQKQAECELDIENKIHQKQYGIFQVLHTIAAKRVKVVEIFYWQSYHSVLHGNLKFVSCHIIRIISAVIVMLQCG